MFAGPVAVRRPAVSGRRTEPDVTEFDSPALRRGSGGASRITHDLRSPVISGPRAVARWQPPRPEPTWQLAPWSRVARLHNRRDLPGVASPLLNRRTGAGIFHAHCLLGMGFCRETVRAVQASGVSRWLVDLGFAAEPGFGDGSVKHPGRNKSAPSAGSAQRLIGEAWSIRLRSSSATGPTRSHVTPVHAGK